MTNAPIESTTRSTPAALGNGSPAIEKSVSKSEAPAATKGFDPQAMFTNAASANGGPAVVAGLQDLMQAYQAMARRNGEKLTASIHALATVKTPTEFMELQRKLVTESVASAVSDSATIGKLTTAAFTAAFEPMRKQVEMLQGGSKS